MTESLQLTLENDEGGAVDLDPGLLPDAPAPPPEPAPAPEPTAPVVAAPAGDDDGPDVGDPATETDPQIRGLKTALKSEREKRKSVKAAADAGMELARQLRSRPDIIAALQSGAPLQAPAAPAAAAPVTPAPPWAPEVPADVLRELAESMGLYDADNKPDLAAAKRVHAYTERVARSAAEEIVGRQLKPLQDERLQVKAQAKRAEALDVAKTLGVDDAIASRIIDGLVETNPEVLSSPEAASTAILVAVGIDTLRRNGNRMPAAAAPAAPAAPTARPVFTETPRSAPAALILSALEQRVAKKVGIKPDAWAASLAGLGTTPGYLPRHIALEDEES